LKKAIALILALMLGISLLAACGGDNTPSNTPDNTPGNVTPPSDNTGGGGTPAPDAKGETYDTGNFSVYVPGGWLAIPITRNGAPDPDALAIYKGAQDESGMMSCPGIKIYYPVGHDVDPKTKSRCSNVSDLAPLTLENCTWEGFSGDYNGSPVTVLLNDGDEGFEVLVWTKAEFGDETISIRDADVLAIIASISREGMGSVNEPDPAEDVPEPVFEYDPAKDEDQGRFFGGSYSDTAGSFSRLCRLTGSMD
jgi:hypothetical protein